MKCAGGRGEGAHRRTAGSLRRGRGRVADARGRGGWDHRVRGTGRGTGVRVRLGWVGGKAYIYAPRVLQPVGSSAKWPASYYQLYAFFHY
jgi:hypothetical protein